MRVVEVDTSGWLTIQDYCVSLRAAIGARKEHGCSIDAFLDSMVWHEDLNESTPPYTIRMTNVGKLPIHLSEEVRLLSEQIAVARQHCIIERGYDVVVVLEIIS